MLSNRIAATLVLALTAVVLVPSARADFTVRECIKYPGTPGKAWYLPPASGWKSLGELEFNHLTTSDYVVTALVGFHEQNTPGTQVEYQIMLDGSPHGWYVRRVPRGFPSSQVIRSTIANVPAGQHTLGIRARNLSSTAGVQYEMFWITPLLVDGTETTAGTIPSGDVVVTSSWSTLLQRTINVASGKMAFLDSYMEIRAGTANHALEYRVLRNGLEIYRLEDSVPDVLRDGIHFAYIDKTPASSSTYTIQARSLTGSSTTFRARSLFAQTVPEVTVFESAATNVTVPSNGSWQPLTATGWVTPASASLGSVGTDGYGFAQFTYDGLHNNETLVQFDLESLQAGWLFEVGVRFVHSSDTGKELEALASDWEQLGLKGSDQYKLTLKARGLCSTSQNISYSKVHFQVMAVPDDNGFVNPGTCANAPYACCANNADCTVYTCEASGELSLVNVSGLDCPF